MYSLNSRERKNRTVHAARGAYRLHVGAKISSVAATAGT